MPLKTEIKRLVDQADDDGVQLGNSEWWQLSKAESEVFDIDLAVFPRMVLAWQLYQVLVGIVGTGAVEIDYDLVEAERDKFPALEIGVVDKPNFTKLACEWIGLSQREANAMYGKVEYWETRNGSVFPDEQERGL